jgi:alpha-glucoside transport system permease protein
MVASAAEVRGKAKKLKADQPPGGARKFVALGFLAPAAVVLLGLVVYPSIDTIIQSFQNPDRTAIVGVDNYKEMFANDRIFSALKNNAIWVAIAPALITGLGLVFATLTERVKYGTAIKLILFMPMAISMLATGVFWRLMYEQDLKLGVVNAAMGGVYNLFNAPGPYPEATFVEGQLPLERQGEGAIELTEELQPGDTGAIGLTGILEGDLPSDATQAAQPEAPSDGIGLVVWRDFKPGGGQPGEIEEGEVGLPGATVELVDSSGEVVATEVTGPNGSVSFSGVGGGPFTARVAGDTFEQGWTGVRWLGPTFITIAIIVAFTWAQIGLAVVVIGAGLAALPRDLLEAARVDGANEWQVFRRITFPLLRPIVGVVFITLVINTLKIFDLIYVLVPNLPQAQVIATEIFRTTFAAREFGVGAALAVLLFILVIPIMFMNVRRLRREV